ncbi:chromosome partitioning protein ParB [Chlorogloeopsis fritschii PCC 6912]|uniref:Chromosome partitioning protein ParB n=1 Tax=Chlorogloeopsis fritschii PCC 6912 TaxID=211165 RepID=A0A433N6B9_CHLFR|nr:ParB N-terminal domain-containing protein [Chlorogloeopsis fritschii]RUR77034.1 chromosome partitioning protein ParB [Chlorogloeopsis fritschii PCC 6912]
MVKNTHKVTKIERSVKISISQLHPNPWNPNKTSQRQQEAIAESLREYSQVLELIVRPHPDIEGEYQIIDGEHRYQESSDYVYANVLHGLSDAEAKKLTVVLNETRGTADKIELSQLLADIKIDLGADLITSLPYTEVELGELVNLADINWDDFSTDNQEGNNFNGDGGGEDLKIITFKVSPDDYQYLESIYNLIKDQEPLDKNKAIAWGQVLVTIAKDFLAVSPNS